MTALSTAPVEETTLADIAEDEQHRHDQRALAVRALRAMRKDGWVRSRSYDFARQLGYVFYHPDHPQLLHLDTHADLTIWYGWFTYEVEDIRIAVDMLAALDVLPVRLSSVYGAGYTVGMADGMEHVTELSIETRFDLYVDETWEKLHEPDTIAWIGRELDGLLDRHPFARRAQTDRIIDTVLKAAGVGE